MMKRLVSTVMMLALCLVVLAQGKLTPDVQMQVMKQKARVERKAAAARENGKAYTPTPQEQRITLVVKVSEKDAAATFRQLRASGAKVQSKLGRQAVITLPVDSVDAITKIGGVERIDVTHKGRLKTDVTREETGVNLVGGGVPGAMAYTGKGVTVCLIDLGFDFQHPAFKDANGNSRIKCVYMMGDNNGNKFSIEDPEAGTIEFPGSVYDTPELIATLTTDYPGEYHGSHTANIAAGSLSPQGFGGMAPEADLVLIPMDDVEVEGYDDVDASSYIELALAFADAYASKSQQPMVLSASINSHLGPHDGTSSVTEAIESVSKHVIPVFSAGNEGGYPIHLYQKFTSAKSTISTVLIAITEDESGEHEYLYIPNVVGFTRVGDEVSVQLSLCSVNPFTGKLSALWKSEICTATPGCEPVISYASSEDDSTLAKYFDGEVEVAAGDYEDGRLLIHAAAYGGMDDLYLFVLTLSGSYDTEIDAWDEMAGFAGVNYIGLPGYVDGDNLMSAGDWTSTNSVVSVGAYCANVMCRNYDGQVTNTSLSTDPDEDIDVKDDIAWFSSYGTSFNGVEQPVVCAPGVNIVSALSHYAIDGDEVAESMQWQGYPYGAESGTSMSCPVVSGIIALWLQANPSMNLDDVKEVLQNSSSNDSFTAVEPERWGFGKINCAKGIEYITTLQGIEDLTYRQEPGNTGIIYDLQGRRMSGNLSHGIYIKDGKKVVVK